MGGDVCDDQGNFVGRDAAYQDGMYGLVIRERPQPDNSYQETAAVVAEDSFYYMPYAYGKHTREPTWPFWEMDIVATRLNEDDRNVIEAGNSWCMEEWQR